MKDCLLIVEFSRVSSPHTDQLFMASTPSIFFIFDVNMDCLCYGLPEGCLWQH